MKGKMRKIIAAVTAAVALLLAPLAHSQSTITPTTQSNVTAIVTAATPAPTSTTTPDSILSMLQSYIVNNDAAWNGWTNNRLTLFEAAKFQNVNGVAGASSVGNVLGLEVPVYKHVITAESLTEFEQLFGDVHSQSFGAAYNYNLHQIQLTAGIDVQYAFTGNQVRAVPFIEFKKASTTLYGMCPFVRWAFPIESHPGGGYIYVGMALPL